jgi:dCMP deaminase
VTDWDRRFLELAKHVGQWSKDPSTKVGAVIVRPNKSVLSVGFNGFPQMLNDDPAILANREAKYSRTVHAEINALIFAYGSAQRCSVYTSFMCCDRCAIQMLQAGVSRFVYPKPTADELTRWGSSFKLTESYFEEADVIYKEIEL